MAKCETKQGSRHATGVKGTSKDGEPGDSLAYLVLLFSVPITSWASPSAGRVHTYKMANRRRNHENGHEGAARAGELSRAGSNLHLVKPSTASRE